MIYLAIYYRHFVVVTSGILLTNQLNISSDGASISMLSDILAGSAIEVAVG